MEQRRLRLGDILDDYCPRERRVTNHAVVAMVEETVKQTRCTTCDAEHPYKGGQAPRRRKKDGPSALYKEVLAGKPDTDRARRIDDAPEVFAAADAPDDGDSADGDVNGNVMTGSDGATCARDREPASAVRRVRRELAARRLPSPILEDADERVPDLEDGPVHRQLIRATLPRIEGQKEERRPTDFTIRQPGGRGNNVGNQFRGGGGAATIRSRSGGRGGKVAAPATGWQPGHRGNGHRPRAARGLPARAPVRGKARAGARPGARSRPGWRLQSPPSSLATAAAAGNGPGSPSALSSVFRRALCLNALRHAGRDHAALSRLVASASVRFRARAPGIRRFTPPARCPRGVARARSSTPATDQVRAHGRRSDVCRPAAGAPPAAGRGRRDPHLLAAWRLLRESRRTVARRGRPVLHRGRDARRHARRPDRAAAAQSRHGRVGGQSRPASAPWPAIRARG